VRRNSRGLTLVEVMVSLVLSSLVVAGGFALMSSQRPVISGQLRIGKRQQDLWVATELLQRDFRRAGMAFGVCRATVAGVIYRAHANVWPSGAGSKQVLRPITINDNAGPGGTDTLLLNWFEPTGVGGGAQFTTTSGDLWGAASVGTAPPFAGAQSFMTPGGVACGSAAFPAGGRILALVFNGNASGANQECLVVEVTGANCTTNTLTIDPRPQNVFGFQTPVYTPPALYATTTDHQIANLGVQRSVLYAIVPGDAVQPPRLTRQVNGGAVEDVAIGIEDMQLVPACDVNNDGVINLEGADDAARATDEWFYNVAGDTTPATCTSFPQVRVSLVSRTLSPDPGFNLPGRGRPALENHAAGAPDQFHRRLISSVIRAQNADLR
jgi:prepilin-type N-terminal cleavage/methylation domain-containing protein